MSEAIILGVIHEFESFRVSRNIRWIVEEITDELKMMLDFLRVKNSGKRSRMLSHLLADFAEMAQDSVDRVREFVKNTYTDGITGALDGLQKAKNRIMELGVDEGVSRTRSVEEEGDKVVVVGLEKDVQQLIGRAILNEKLGLMTSCIKGMLGVGKTTLARQVYSHPAIIGKFEGRAWVSISSNATHEVLVELIQQLVGLDGEEMDNRSLREMLRGHLQRSPCFIVLDNIVPEMPLESFFLGAGDGSRMLLTSRYKIERKNVGYTHEMKALDSDKSWQLFLKAIDKFTSDENKFTKELERKGKEMLKKCGGLPEAIIDVARQKAKQRLSGIEWEELFDSIDLDESLKKLEPMYHELDEEHKTCFLHMSFFKENAIMREEKLEQFWDASGFNGLDSYRRRGLAYSLFCKSIIEVVYPYPSTYNVRRCRINPLLHRLSIKKS